MTPDEEVYGILLGSGLRGTKNAWPIGGAPPLPWFVYKREKKGEFFADNENFARMWRYRVELYQAEPDDDVADALEQQLSQIGPYSSYETWIPGENCWETSYTLTYHPDN